MGEDESASGTASGEAFVRGRGVIERGGASDTEGEDLCVNESGKR